MQWTMPWDHYDVHRTHLKLCRPPYRQGVAANSKPHLDQLPCFMERKDHSPGLKGVTPGPRALETEPSSECRPWLLLLHSLYRLCHSSPTHGLDISFSVVADQPYCHFPSANSRCAKLSGLFLTLGYRRKPYHSSTKISTYQSFFPNKLIMDS